MVMLMIGVQLTLRIQNSLLMEQLEESIAAPLLKVALLKQKTKEHISKAGKLYEGVEKTLASVSESSEDAKRFKQQMGAMAENLSALNTVYGNMLTAMSIGKK
mgnify:CR=1 FL=1